MLLLFALGCAPPSPAIDVRLDGAWHGNPALVHLPSTQPFREALVTRSVTVPPEWAGGMAELELAATGWRVHASLDGREVGQGTGGSWPARVKLTDRLTPGTHTIAFAIDAPSPENIVPGSVVNPVSAWLWGMPRAGEREARGPITLRLSPARRVERVEARLVHGGDTVEASARTVGVAEGTPVALTLVRDGATQLTLSAIVDVTGLARTTAPWSGPRWPDPAGLAWIVADAGEGARRQARIGLRSVEERPDGLYLDGARTYLVASRLAGSQVGSRAALAASAPTLAAAGANAVEVHGEILSPELFDAADELGLPVVLTPRCDGERREPGNAPEVPDTPAHVAFVNAGDTAALDALRAHPSIVLWTVEAPVSPWGIAREPALDVDGLAVMDERENSNFADPSLPPRGVSRGPTPFYGELPWVVNNTPGFTFADRLANVFAAHVGTGVGLVLPALARSTEVDADRAAMRAVITAAGITPVDLSQPRRGVSTLVVRVSTAGKPAEGIAVQLDLPKQLPLGAFSDAEGIARFDVDYAGDATVHIPGGASSPVTLVPGTWTPGRWVPHVVEVKLAKEGGRGG